MFFVFHLFVFFVFFALCSTQDQPQQTMTTQKPEKPENSENGKTSGSKPVHKWPIRPGVHVHVNGLHALGGISTVNAAPTDISGFSYGAKNSTGGSGSETSHNDSGNPIPNSGDDSEPEKVAKGTCTDSTESVNKEKAGQNINNNNNNASSQSNCDLNSSNSSQESKGTKITKYI
jgi:hypothetical protein